MMIRPTSTKGTPKEYGIRREGDNGTDIYKGLTTKFSMALHL
jgi:hypothetical protein